MGSYTVVLRRSGSYWVALCLENGLVGQGNTKENAIHKVRDAIDSLEDVRRTEKDVYFAPVPIKELNEFLTVEGEEPSTEVYELRAVHA